MFHVIIRLQKIYKHENLMCYNYQSQSYFRLAHFNEGGHGGLVVELRPLNQKIQDLILTGGAVLCP